MPNKSFEHTIPFIRHEEKGAVTWLPLVSVYLFGPGGQRHELSLIFDTGASNIVLRHDLFSLLGLKRWDEGPREDTGAVGSEKAVKAHKYKAKFEFLGTTAECEILLTRLPSNPLFQGLFGREPMFKYFGFGFWESAKELYVTQSP